MDEELLKRAFRAGWDCSSEGWNSEWPPGGVDVDNQLDRNFKRFIDSVKKDTKQ